MFKNVRISALKNSPLQTVQVLTIRTTFGNSTKKVAIYTTFRCFTLEHHNFKCIVGLNKAVDSKAGASYVVQNIVKIELCFQGLTVLIQEKQKSVFVIALEYVGDNMKDMK